MAFTVCKSVWIDGVQMTLQEAMQQATAEVIDERDLEDAAQINEYDCFNWAFKVFNLVPGTQIGGHRIDGEGQSYIVHRGRFYDSESPDGVSYCWQLPSIQRMLEE